MEHERIVDRLNEYVDGDLPARERREVEAHLTSCEPCRARVEGLRALLDAAVGLPRSLEPARDLWPAIDARLENRPSAPSSPMRSDWRGRLPSSRPALAAAAVLLIAVASTLAVWMTGERVVAPDRADRGGVDGPAAVARVADWRALERRYEDATSELQETLDVLGPDLAPETRRIVEENLRVIDRAIAESRAALARDPGNRELTRLLSAAYERKLEMLRHVSRL